MSYVGLLSLTFLHGIWLAWTTRHWCAKTGCNRPLLACYLYWYDYITVGNLFGVGKFSVFKCIHHDRLCEALVKKITLNIMYPFQDLTNVIQGYQDSWGFPICGGAIDGTHIPIIGPVESHGDYLNRKGYYSLIMQGVCDNKYIFRDINIGWPGRVQSLLWCSWFCKFWCVPQGRKCCTLPKLDVNNVYSRQRISHVSGIARLISWRVYTLW